MVGVITVPHINRYGYGDIKKDVAVSKCGFVVYDHTEEGTPCMEKEKAR